MVNMSKRKSKNWRRITIAALCLAAPAAVSLAEDWNVVRPNNRPYVSFANVAQFYQFPEYTRVSRLDLGKDLPFYQNLDLLVFDAQYELEELLNKHDWGHSSAPIGIDLALREGIKTLVLIHHDPWASDERLRQSAASAKKYVKMNLKWYEQAWTTQPEGPTIITAYDGLTVKV